MTPTIVNGSLALVALLVLLRLGLHRPLDASGHAGKQPVDQHGSRPEADAPVRAGAGENEPAAAALR